MLQLVFPNPINFGQPMTPSPTPAVRQFPCKQCGANLVFSPGTTCLKCPYCGTENEIAADVGEVAELDFRTQMAQMQAAAPTQETLAVRCNACGAETDLSHNVVADQCPFCGAAIVAVAASKRVIKPGALLPFIITRQQAEGAFAQWVRSLWFAPSNLAKLAQRARIDGAYIPAWTYDSNTDSLYAGQRGDDYWVTETYSAMENGRSVTRTRQVRRTRWRSVSGRVGVNFDDVLILATRSLPPKQSQALEPWDLKALVPYRDEFLSGFAAETYSIGLDEGFQLASQVMEQGIRQSVNRDIGGDHQRIDSLQTQYLTLTFKSILLPMWISAYRYTGRPFRFLVNARTGEVQGERPYSAWKITLLVLACLVLAAILFFVFSGRGGSGVGRAGPGNFRDTSSQWSDQRWR